MSKTKIVVIQLKEIIYTAIFVGLGILLILLLVFMFLPKGKGNQSASKDATEYVPGVYTNQITLGDASLNVEVVLDENHINSVSITNLDESITTMYPLVEPALDEIETQLQNGVEPDDVVLSDDYRYTEMLLLNAVDDAIGKAEK